MQEGIASTIRLPGSQESLHEILRRGAQQLLAQAIEAEVAAWINERQQVTDEQGRRQVVRNGYLPERKLITGVGEVAIQQPRVHALAAAQNVRRIHRQREAAVELRQHWPDARAHVQRACPRVAAAVAFGNRACL